MRFGKAAATTRPRAVAAWSRLVVAISLLVLALPANLSSCAAKAGAESSGGGDRSQEGTRVLLLRDVESAAGATDLPAFVAVAVVPDGRSPYADRLAQVLGDAQQSEAVGAVVAMGPRKGLAGALLAAKATAARQQIWIAVTPADDPLAIEASADLVVDLDPSQAVDDSFQRAFERGLCELARRAASGKAKIDDAVEIAGALRSAGGYEWKVTYRVDPPTGVKARNHVMVSAQPRG